MKAKTVLRYIEYALTFMLIILAAYSVIEFASGTTPFYVVSDYPSSMSPTMNYATVGMTYHTPFQDLKVGDIIVFHDPLDYPRTIVHRIVAIVPCGSGNQKCLETKGDNNATNPTKDPWNVTQAEYEGQVILIIPYVGYLSPSLWGFEGAAVAIPIIFIILLVALVSYYKDQRKKATTKENDSGNMNG